MVNILSATSKSIQQALASWAVAVEAVLKDIDRIAKGGQSNPAVTDELIAAVEAVRQQCEEAQPL